MAKNTVDALPLILLGVGAYFLFKGQNAPAGIAPSRTGTPQPIGNRSSTITASTQQAYNSSQYIKWVQQSLNYLNGAGLQVDGVSGPLTKAAVQKFQQQWGIKADGIVGPETDYYLNAAQGMPGYTDQPYSPVPSGEVWY